MAAIYLRHSIHGTKVAIAEEEALFDEKNGWVRFDPHETKKEEVDEAIQIPTNTLRLRRK